MTCGKHFKQEDFKIIGKSMKFLQNLEVATNPYTSIAYFYSFVGGEGCRASAWIARNRG